MVFKSRSVLRKHRETHKKVHCTACDLVCRNKTEFKKHCKEAHPEPKKTYDCPYEGCSKTYSTGSNLNQHVRVEHAGLRFHCEVEGCGKSFRYNINLKRHIASHEAPAKKTKKKRKRKSLAAKLAKYKGELCELPVTYVDPNEDISSPSESASCKETQSNHCSDITMDSPSHVENKTEEISPATCSAEISSSGSESVPKSLPSELCKETQSSQCSDISTDTLSQVENQSDGLSSAICSLGSLSSKSENGPMTLMERLQSVIKDGE
ncbi:transcription factor IIIA-like [Dendronephthya gigantea]|uniref:transcription factor IIIA-like n=1 Tax=Dendronephthya gigantea TaxID=151771 RepID=UPI00106AB00C|nr:transcription factor IIIA-like [Dendronephthya gigantea]